MKTHVVVVATRFGSGNWSIDEHPAAAMVRRQIRAAKLWLPPKQSAVVIVDNMSPDDAAAAMRAACANESDALIICVKNEDWARGFGYELGAWRWAVKKVLPSLALVKDAIVYLMQDSLRLAAPALPQIA